MKEGEGVLLGVLARRGRVCARMGRREVEYNRRGRIYVRVSEV